MRCKRGISTTGGLVPCGRCLPCRILKRQVWASRILQEWITHPGLAFFVTLTYDDANVPLTREYVPTLRKRKLQNWIREANRETGGFRYYAVGEYGDRTLRPHYHLAVFLNPGVQIGDVTRRWTQGFTSTSELNVKRSRYLAEYTTKKLTSAADERLASDQEPEFRLSSRRPPLGAALVPKIVSRYRSRQGAKIIEERGDIETVIRIEGRIYPLGPWLVSKVRTELGIPLLERDRMLHPGYEKAEREIAECDPEKADQLEIFLNAEKNRKTHRTPHFKL